MTGEAKVHIIGSLNIGLTGIAAGILLTSLGILASAYASQYFGGIEPCRLCLYQRWPWWIASGFGLVACSVAPRRPHWTLAMSMCGITLISGTVLALYHVGIEQHWWLGPTSCTTSGTPTSLEELKSQILATPIALCDQIPWSLLGISLAGYNAIASFVVGTASLAATWRIGS